MSIKTNGINTYFDFQLHTSRRISTMLRKDLNPILG